MTEFEKRVYKIVKEIPRGRTLAYKEVAQKLGNAKLARAVGNALSKNKNPKIPCHRVIRRDGQINGYNNGAINKNLILKKEGVIIKDQKVVSS